MDQVCQVLVSELKLWGMYAPGLAAGLFVSVVIGHFGVTWFYKWQKRWLDEGWDEVGYDPEKDKKAIRPSILGRFERIIFTVAFALDIVSTGTAAGAWLALKMSTHWNKLRDGITPREQKQTNSYAMLGLLTGLLSMAFAVLGGLIALRIWTLMGLAIHLGKS